LNVNKIHKAVKPERWAQIDNVKDSVVRAEILHFVKYDRETQMNIIIV